MNTKLDNIGQARGYLRTLGIHVDGMQDGEIPAYIRTRFPRLDISAFHTPPTPAAAAVVRADANEFRTDSPTPPPAAALPEHAPAKRLARLDAAYEASFQKPDETADAYHARAGTAAQAAEKLQAEQRLRAGTHDVYAEAYTASFKNGGRP